MLPVIETFTEDVKQVNTLMQLATATRNILQKLTIKDIQVENLPNYYFKVKFITESGYTIETGAVAIPAGPSGTTPHIGSNGNWFIGDTDTGIHAQGPQGATGEDGTTPHIGLNGNWFIGDTDTGIHAQGPQGEPGATGATGATGSQGPQGETGEQGPQGVSVVGVAVNASNHLIVTLSTGATIDAGEIAVSSGGVTSLGGATGDITLGSGLTMNNNKLSASGGGGGTQLYLHNVVIDTNKRLLIINDLATPITCHIDSDDPADSHFSNLFNQGLIAGSFGGINDILGGSRPLNLVRISTSTIYYLDGWEGNFTSYEVQTGITTADVVTAL